MIPYWDSPMTQQDSRLGEAIRVLAKAARRSPDLTLILLADLNKLAKGKLEQANADADTASNLLSGMQDQWHNALVDNHQLAQTLTTLSAELETERARVSDLEAQLEQANAPPIIVPPPPLPPVAAEPLPVIVLPTLPTPNGRALYGVNSSFDETRLQGESLKRYKQTWGRVNNFYRLYVEPQTRGGHYLMTDAGELRKDANGQLIFERYKDGALDIYGLRAVQYWADDPLDLLERVGDAKAFDVLHEIIPHLIKNAAYAYTWTVSAAEKALEQAGVGRFIDWQTGGQNADGSRALDSDLSRATFAKLNFAMWQNNDRAISQRISDFFLNHIMKRSYYRGIMTYGGVERKALWKAKNCDALSFRAILDLYRDAGLAFPLEMWGHNLSHAVSASSLTMHLAYLQYGWPEFKESRDRLGKWNQDAHAFIQTKFGELTILPHNIRGRFEQLGWTGGEAAEDCTYLREKFRADRMAYVTGHPFVTKRMLAGLSRTVHYTVMYDYPKLEWAAGALSGYSAKPGMKEKRVIVLRDGSEVESPYKMAGPAANIRINAMQRGGNCVFDELTGPDKDKLVAETMRLNDSEPSVNQGNAISLFLAATVRQ